MLARKYKIGSRLRTAAVLKKGMSKKYRYFFVKYLKNRSANVRAAVVVSTKVARTAVRRNRVRRRLYEAIRLAIPASASPCYDIAVLATGASYSAPFEDLPRDILHFLKTLP